WRRLMRRVGERARSMSPSGARITAPPLLSDVTFIVSSGITVLLPSPPRGGAPAPGAGSGGGGFLFFGDPLGHGQSHPPGPLPSLVAYVVHHLPDDVDPEAAGADLVEVAALDRLGVHLAGFVLQDDGEAAGAAGDGLEGLEAEPDGLV